MGYNGINKMSKRECGDCQLCCKLLPVHDVYRVDGLSKKAGVKCKHQRFGKGCMVYNKPEMPMCCTMWNCRWLVDEIPKDIGRPDRVHYVIDVMPDFITLQVDDIKSNIQVVQIWCDPKYPDAHRDPALRRWLETLATEKTVGLVRYNEKDCFVIFPPAMCDDNQWHEAKDNTKAARKQHSMAEIVETLGKL